jgi:hypothetical protein
MTQRTKRGVTRRRVLESGAGLLAAAAAPVRLHASQRQPEPAVVSTDLTGRVARYMATARQQPLPPDVLRETKHRVLDTVAAMISGAKLKPDGRTVTHFTRHAPGTKENPLDTAGVATKARTLIAPVLGDQRCQQVITRINTLESAQRVRPAAVRSEVPACVSAADPEPGESIQRAFENHV